MNGHRLIRCLAVMALASVSASAQVPAYTPKTVPCLPHDSNYWAIKARLDAALPTAGAAGPLAPIGSNARLHRDRSRRAKIGSRIIAAKNIGKGPADICYGIVYEKNVLPRQA